MPDITNTRRNDLDWLRVLAVLLLVPFHSALIFNLNPQAVMYVKDTVNSPFLDRLTRWIHQFHMPLLFYVSGAATYFSLKKRKGGQYVKERFLKLLIPAIAGLIFIIPAITYITQISEGNPVNFWQHFINFWQFGNTDLTGMDGKFTPAHLWFLFFLFFFSLIGLPLFSILKKDKSTALMKRIIDKTGIAVILLVLFILLTFTATLNILGDKNPVYYFLMFFCGYLFMMDDRFQSNIDKYALLFLLTSVSCELMRQFSYSFISNGTVILVLSNLNRWAWLLCILGYGHRYLKKSNNTLKYLSSAAYPFYIFHMLVNTMVGFYVIQLPFGAGIKYAIIVVLTILSTFIVYEIIKRIPIIRFAFGIRPGRK
ncbi:MAG: acyltransferase family protein [Bacteroidales bacterium]|jgi:peptidoglycan/LPS O-acetylase OafA/YrhL